MRKNVANSGPPSAIPVLVLSEAPLPPRNISAMYIHSNSGPHRSPVERKARQCVSVVRIWGVYSARRLIELFSQYDFFVLEHFAIHSNKPLKP